jgi:hypothetical protein
VTTWHKHEDLAADITGIAQALDTLRILNHAQFVYKKVSSNKRLQPTDLEGLQLLPSLAEKHQLIATLRALPPLPANLSKKIVTIDPEIVTAIVRFPVRDELESLNRSNQGGLENYLSDFADFFKTTLLGEVRRQGLRNFPKRCRDICGIGHSGLICTPFRKWIYGNTGSDGLNMVFLISCAVSSAAPAAICEVGSFLR